MIFSSLHYYSRILGFLHVKFIADFRTMVKACSGHQFSLCGWFTYRTIIPPTTVTMPAAATAILAPSLFCHPLWMLTMPWVLSITHTFAPCFMPDNSCIFYLVLM